MPVYVSHALQTQLLDQLRIREHDRLIRTHYYLETAIFPPSTPLPVYQNFLLPEPSILIFADDNPSKNWTHGCRYLLFHATTLQHIATLNGELPPYFFNKTAVDSYIPFLILEPLPAPHHKPNFRMKKFKPNAPGNRFAVLYSGRSNYCHVNDLGFMHQTLTEAFGYTSSNIKVLNYDGITRVPASSSGTGSLSDYASRMPIAGAATKANLKVAISGFSYSSNDSLLIYASNHGKSSSVGPYLFGYLDETPDNGVTADELAGYLEALPVRIRSLMAMFQQCFASGFIEPILRKCYAVNASVASASLNESTSGTDFNPYSKHWISAMAGVDPFNYSIYPDPDLPPQDTHITMNEARLFAEYKLTSASITDHPQFDFKNTGNDDVLGE